MRFFRAFQPAAAALALALAAGSSAGAAPTPPPPDPALTALPAQMIAALLGDDVAALRAHCAPSTAVVDEFAPYSWSGPDACVRWAAGFKAFAAHLKLTGFKGTAAPNPFVDVTGSHAYLTSKVTFNATMSGKPISEQGTWTFVLAKSGTAWKITSMAWGTLHH
jgi:ketosteroid isomerase-like protein